MLRILGLVIAVVGLVGSTGPELVSFPTEDGGVVHADLYGSGDRAVVLAHGGRFNKGSWATQAQTLARAGFRVLAIDFRGRGQSRGGPQPTSPDDVHFDVLAAVRYLHETGARSVSVVGGSFGGWAAARAAVEAKEGEIDRIVLLAASAIDEPERMTGRKLFITTRDDFSGSGTPRLPEIRDQYERAPDPKQLVILEGSAHAQHIFKTEQAERLMQEILRFLSEPPAPSKARDPCAAAADVWARNDQVGWGPVVLGMARDDLGSLQAESLELREDIDAGHCGTTFADVTIRGQNARLMLSAAESQVVLVFVRLACDCLCDRLLAELKSSLPTLRYTPSRHDPLQEEADNRKPFYAVGRGEELRLLVEPGVGIWLGYDRCFE